MNSGGNCAGFVVPTLAFMIAGCNDHSLDGWNRFILVSAAVISLGGESLLLIKNLFLYLAFIFLIFGTADEQIWKSNESSKGSAIDDLPTRGIRRPRRMTV